MGEQLAKRCQLCSWVAPLYCFRRLVERVVQQLQHWFDIDVRQVAHCFIPFAQLLHTGDFPDKLDAGIGHQCFEVKRLGERSRLPVIQVTQAFTPAKITRIM